MRTARVALDDIVPADYNPRVDLTEDDPEYQQLDSSLTEFGQTVPLIINERTGRLVSGHQRLTVLRAQGADAADVVYVDLDDTDEKALNVALNKLTGRWDDQALLDLLDGLSADGHDLHPAGFDGDDYAQLLRRIDQAHATDFLADLLDDDPDALDPDDLPSGDEGWSTLVWPISADDKKLVLRVLEGTGHPTRADALVAACRMWTDEHGPEETS